MKSATTQPTPALVGARAEQILGLVKRDEGYDRLRDSSQAYAECWATFTGYPVIAEWNLDGDKAALFDEALRSLCLKAAVFELTSGDEVASELLLSLPVDEMTHAIIAQHTLLTQIQIRLRVLFPHMTDREEFGWEPGDYTSQCYAAAGWGDMNPRYWVGTTEAKRRLKELGTGYVKAGIQDLGRRHAITFAQPVAA